MAFRGYDAQPDCDALKGGGNTTLKIFGFLPEELGELVTRLNSHWENKLEFVLPEEPRCLKFGGALKWTYMGVKPMNGLSLGTMEPPFNTGAHIHLDRELTMLDGLTGKKAFLLVDPLQGADGKYIGSIVPSFPPTNLEASSESQYLCLSMEAELRRLLPNCRANNFSIRFSILKGYEVHVNFKRASSLEGFVGDMFEQGKIKFSDESIETTPIFGNDDSNVGRLKVFHDRMRERNEEDITKKAVIFNVHKDADEKKIRRALAAAYQFLWDDEDERVSRACRNSRGPSSSRRRRKSHSRRPLCRFWKKPKQSWRRLVCRRWTWTPPRPRWKNWGAPTRRRQAS